MLSVMQFYEQAARRDGSYPFFVVALIAIIALNVFSIFYYFFNLFLTIKVKYYKTNLQKIHQAIYVTCPISSLFLIGQSILDILGKTENISESNPTFMVLQFMHTVLLSPPLFSLPAITLERIFATCFIKNYEQKPKPIIAYLIVLVLYFISVFTAYVFNFTDFIFVFVAAHLLLIALCYIISLINYRVNRNYYHKNRVTKHEYSLGERYQISENIRMYKFFSAYLFVLAFFTISCTGLALISNYDTSLFHRNVLSVLFDLSFTLLCIFAPYLSVKLSEAWQNELDIILVKVGVRKPTTAVLHSSRKLKNTFGEVMDFEAGKHSDMYFDQLKKSWNRESNREALRVVRV